MKSADHDDLMGLTHDHSLFLPVSKKAARPLQHKAEAFVGVREECPLFN